MKCKDVERMLMDADIPHQIVTGDSDLEVHLSQCQTCSRLMDNLTTLHRQSQTVKSYDLPANLDRSTLSLCLKELSKVGEKIKTAPVKGQWKSVPIPIWAIFFLLTALTLFFILPYFEQFFSGQALPSGNHFTLIIIIQNTFMLFFSPILIGKFRKKRPYYRRINYEFNGNNC